MRRTHVFNKFNQVATAFGLGLLITSANSAIVNEGYKVMAGDGAADDEFGYAVDMSNGIIAVGARNDDDNGNNSGSAYLINVSTGAQIAKLLPSDGVAGDQFGFSIAIQDGVVVVGAPGDVHNGIASGSAYIFDATTGAELAKIVPNDPEAGDEFGNSIAIDDGTVAVGSRTFFVLGEGFTFAKVHLFDANTGDVTRVLQPDIENYNGDQGGQFGDCVDIRNGLVAVGAPHRNVFFDFSGAAYVFDASSGNQLAFLYPDDRQDRDHFGFSIAIDADGMLAIGANEDDDTAWSGGSAYLYEATSGSQVDKLLASDGAEFDMFGSSVAIENGVIAIGATGFGNSAFEGAVYVFGETNESCAADLAEPFGTLNFFDISAYIGLYNAGDPAADLAAPNGTLNFFDISAYIGLYNAGCP